jgi:hypothetical protein
MRGVCVCSIGIGLWGAGLAAGDVDVSALNSQFARDMWASRSSVLIIGDSTNNPRGAGQFVPYYEGFLLELPDRIELCGFRVSGSTGQVGFDRYVSFAGGQESVLVGGLVNVSHHGNDVTGIMVAPPGPRNQMMVRPGQSLLEAGRFASVGFTNLPGLISNAESWIQEATMVLRTSFLTSEPDGQQLGSIAVAPIFDHDGAAGLFVNQFDIGELTDVHFSTDATTLQQIDVEYDQPKSTRVGLLMRGDSDQEDEDESGKTLAWCDHVFFHKQYALQDKGLYLDSISVGGFTAQDHAENLDPELLDDYLQQAPREINTVFVWLGQNAKQDEWTGSLQPVWTLRIEHIANLVLDAAANNGSEPPLIVLCTPPDANSMYPSARFSAMNEALRALALRRGWAHLDVQSILGDSLIEIDPSHLGPGPHPSESGARLVTSLLYAHLDCIRTDYNGDGIKDFFDVSVFLEHFINLHEDADLNGDGNLNFFDVSDFLTSFALEC